MTWIKKGILFSEKWSQLPVVDSDEEHYIIYYSSRIGESENISVPRIILINKKDFSIVDYSKVNIPLGKPGSFDSHGIMPSSIVTLKDGTKYLYYVGWSKRIDVPYWNSTGLAISEDGGLTWEKYSEGPVLSSCGNEPNWIGTVDVQFHEWLQQKEMYYSSCKWENINGKLEPIYSIKRSISSFEDWGMNAEENEILKLKGEEGGIAAFRPFKDKFFYSKRNKLDYRTNIKNSYKIYSIDENGNEQLELEPSGDENMAAYPYIVETEDKYLMFYNGHDFGKGGISLAEKLK